VAQAVLELTFLLPLPAAMLPTTPTFSLVSHTASAFLKLALFLEHISRELPKY
jgi:hypothetical protein